MERIEGVDGSGDTVEADTLEADFPDELGILDSRLRLLGGRDAVEDRERVGRVESECSSGLNS